jgi:hypothetical protein
MVSVHGLLEVVLNRQPRRRKYNRLDHPTKISLNMPLMRKPSSHHKLTSYIYCVGLLSAVCSEYVEVMHVSTLYFCIESK